MHGIHIRNPDEGHDFDFVLDIDHILEWIKIDTHYEFMVAPATLTFHGVDKLAIDIGLAYKEDLIINESERTETTTQQERKAGLRKFCWQINMQSLAGRENRICFEAQGFTQKLTKEPVGPTGQSLEDEER